MVVHHVYYVYRHYGYPDVGMVIDLTPTVLILAIMPLVKEADDPIYFGAMFIINC
ncbi:hypothetical protein ACLB1M_28065 [Escherichia coli]